MDAPAVDGYHTPMPRLVPSHSAFSSVGLLLFAMVILQSGAASAKSLFPMVGPEGATTLRLLWASLLLGVAWRPWRHRLTRRDRGAILVYGLALGGMNLTMYKAFERIPLGIAVGLEFVGPLTVAVVGSRRWLDAAWVALAAAGVVLLLPITSISQPLDPVGILYALAGAACWGAYIIYGKRVAGRVHGGVVTALGMTLGMLVALPFGIARAGADLLRWDAIRLAAVVAVLSSVIPYSMEIVALKRLSARTFGVLMALEPVVACIIGAIILRESLAAIQVLAMGLIIAASIGSTTSSATSDHTPVPAASDDPEPTLPL